MSRSIYVNGRFLTQSTSGVQRYAREILRAIDTMLGEDGAKADWTLIAPKNAPLDLHLRHMKVRAEGAGGGHAWEQTHLAQAARRGVLLSLCNAGPVLHRRQIVVIHDASVFRTPENFSAKYRMFHKALGQVLARTTRRLATVSEFSRRELARFLSVPPEPILVAPNGADHMRDRAPDPYVLERLGVRRQRYFLFVGSPTPNKNLAAATAAFTRLPDKDLRFVIAGSSAQHVFGGAAETHDKRILLPGRLSDGEISGLYQSAAAFVFPSRYEGFGIPPIEAMINRCPVLSSDIAPVREICGDAVAAYFAPTDLDAIYTAMRRVLEESEFRNSAIERGAARAQAVRWRNGAEILKEAAEALA